MTDAPTISVIMPAYNAARYLALAVQDVLNSTFTDLELIVVDDGSTDDTPQVMAHFTDPRIRYVRHEGNRGLVAVLNEGLELARGEFIARMDADDRMVPDRFQRQLAVVRADPGISVLSTYVDIINPDGERTGVWDTDRATVTEAEIRSMMPRTNCIAHPSVLIRRSALGDLRYDPRLVEGEDWDLWLRMLSRGLRIAKLPEPLILYRQHPHSFTGAAKARRPLERRLLTMRRRSLSGEWKKLRFYSLHLSILKAQARTIARHLVSNVMPPLLRGIYRVLTYSPIALLREQQKLRQVLATWKGEQVFMFPYVSMGGAEQVHTGIVGCIADRDPLIIICAFSPDRAFEDRFARSGTMLEIPRLLNHPWTRRATLRSIAGNVNGLGNAVILGSLSDAFFDLLPMLKREIRTLYVQHAFLFQPGANQQHKAWLRHFDRVDGYLFPSTMAMKEFDKFLFHQNVPGTRSSKLVPVPCAAPSFGEVTDHDRTGILFVGRDSVEKRSDLFLRITAELEERSPGRLRFTMVGLEKLANHPHVEFKGIVQDAKTMSELYAAHDILVVTSTREGHCLVVTEAMASGSTVISTPVGDIPSRVDETSTILTSSIDEETVISEAVDAILALDNDRPRMRRMKEAALAQTRQQFDPAEFDRFYRELLLGKGA